jgi:hypothetical protein
MNDKMLQQIKLSSCEEILCEVVGWADEDRNEIVIKNVLRINEVLIPDTESSGKLTYHTLKPWMLYGHDISKNIYLNAITVVAMCSPSPKMREQYEIAVAEFHEAAEEERSEQAANLERDSDQNLIIPNESNIIRFPTL